jgi:hypothetical protein
MAATDNKQLRFDFMHTMPEQLGPAEECRAYLRSIRDEEPSNQKGGNDVAKTKRRTNVSTNR